MLHISIIRVPGALAVSFKTDVPRVFNAALRDFKARVPVGQRSYHRPTQSWIVRAGAADFLGA